MSRHPRPATVLAFGLGSLVVPVLELVLYRLFARDPFNPSPLPWRKPWHTAT